MTEFKYCVYCEEEPAICFDNEADAMKFAREDTGMYKEVRVEKTEVDEDGDVLNSEVIWSASNVLSDGTVKDEKDNPFETDFPQSDIENINYSDDVDYDELAKQYEDTTPADWDDPSRFTEAVDAMEENENEVECKVCFELFPKESCVKTDKGYVCQKCNQELHSHQGTNLDLIDKDPFSLDYEDPRLPEEEEKEPEVKDEPLDANEIRKHEEGIEEQLKKEITNKWDVFNHYVNNWLDCDIDSDMLELAFERGLKGKDLPSKWYDAAWLKWDDLDYLESINETGKDIKSKGLQAVIQDIAEAESETGDPQDIQDLKEHVNDRPADIESDQVLQGTDNAVVDCEVAKVIAHSEDEKPVDCKMEKPALEEPLAGEEVDVKINEDLSEEEAKELDKEIENLEEELKVIIDFSEYKPWSGAIDTYELIRDANKLDDLEAYLEECYPEGITATQINDILWFDGDQVLSYLGLGDVEDEDEEVDEALNLNEEAPEIIHAKRNSILNKAYGKKEGGKGFSVYNMAPGANYEFVRTFDDIQTAIRFARDESKKTNKVAKSKVEIVDEKATVVIFIKGKDYQNKLAEYAKIAKATAANEKRKNKGTGPEDEGSEGEGSGETGEDSSEKVVEKVIVTFSPNGGVGETKSLEVEKDKTFALPECTFEAPAEKEFKAWRIDGVEKAAGEEITFSSNTNVDAIWKDKVSAESEGDGGSEEAADEETGSEEAKKEELEKQYKAIIKIATEKLGYPRNKLIVANRPTKLLKSIWQDIYGTEMAEGLEEELTEAKKDEELPVDPEAAKLEVHTMLNDLVADEIEAINGYEEAKKEILDAPISHKDTILDTVDHIEDEEKEHIDELIDATTEIPFDKEETPAPVVEEPAAEEPVIEKPLDQEFPEVEENLEEKVGLPSFDSEVKVGDKIRIIHLEGEDNSYDGKEGTVEHIDDIGQLHGSWGGLAVIPGVDDFEVITDESLKEDLNTDTILEELRKDLQDKEVEWLMDTFDADDPLDRFEDPEDWKATVVNTELLVNDRLELDFGPCYALREDKITSKKDWVKVADYATTTIDLTKLDLSKPLEDLKKDLSDLIIDTARDKINVSWPRDDESLTEDIKNYAKAEDFLKNPENKWKWLDLEWETERDIFGISIEWDAEKNCFKAYTSVYHASEDNNAEYPERHTDEEEYSADTLEELYKELSEEFGEEFVKAFESELNSKQLTEASSAEKKAFKNGGEDYNDLINGTAIGMIKNPKARAAAVAALKAGRKDLLKAYIGDRHKDAAIDLLNKKQTAMANAGMTDESLKEDIAFDENGDETFTPEEQEEYDCDEWGYSNSGYDQYHHCGWCEEIFPESEMRHEVDFGWICDRCEAELKSHGGPLTFIENEALKEEGPKDKDIEDIIDTWGSDTESEEQPVEEPKEEQPAESENETSDDVANVMKDW